MDKLSEKLQELVRSIKGGGLSASPPPDLRPHLAEMWRSFNDRQDGLSSQLGSSSKSLRADLSGAAQKIEEIRQNMIERNGPMPSPGPFDPLMERLNALRDKVSLSGPASSPVLLPPPGAGYEQQLNAIKGLLAEDPGRVAQVVKEWINADE